MKKIRMASFFLLLLHLIINCMTRSASFPSKDLLGIAPQDEMYYKVASGAIKCRDGSKKFSKSQLNDDFCDCVDGTDEPGTSACPNGKFYCRNAGHTPLFVHSSRVNDGICDCCDGSDEYDGKVNCSNTCWEAGKVARERLKKKITTYQEGITLRKREIEQAKLAVAKDEAELLKLKNEEKVLKGLVQQLKERKELIEKAEEKERLQREKEEEKRKAEKEESKAEEKADSLEGESMKSSNDDKIGLLEDSPKDETDVHDNFVADVDEHDENERSQSNGAEQHDDSNKEEESATAYKTDPLDTGSKATDGSENSESLSREELGRIVGSRWTGKKSDEQQSVEVDAAENHEEPPKDENEEEYTNGYDTENEDDHHKYDDDDDSDDQIDEDLEEEDHVSSSSYKYDSDDESNLSDMTSTSNPTWLEKVQQTVRKIMQAVNLFQTPVDKSEADHIRKEYEESTARLSKMQSRISSLTEKLKKDFGPEKEFYSYYGRCLESKQNKYVYKICPFKQATQEEGHSTTRLGNWEKFEDSYRIMHFSNGDKCWNGPDRSLKVRLRCGLKNEVTDVGEPSRCEYEALLSTPAVCVEGKLKELQDKLDLLNKEQPTRQGHDEL
ncbi:hypothetical protein LguiA_002448 [Lonicera macranthoides]